MFAQSWNKFEELWVAQQSAIFTSIIIIIHANLKKKIHLFPVFFSLSTKQHTHKICISIFFWFWWYVIAKCQRFPQSLSKACSFFWMMLFLELTEEKKERREYCLSQMIERNLCLFNRDDWELVLQTSLLLLLHRLLKFVTLIMA